jgi:hypothetical protein
MTDEERAKIESILDSAADVVATALSCDRPLSPALVDSLEDLARFSVSQGIRAEPLRSELEKWRNRHRHSVPGTPPVTEPKASQIRKI